MSQSGSPETSISTMHGSQAYAGITSIKEGCKVMTPRNDRGSRCTDKDRREETEDRALISAIKHIQVNLRRL